jgi:hypothetical protein
MAGLVPAISIHEALRPPIGIAGTSPAMTAEFAALPRRHFTGATATAIVQTSLPRLTISRLSFGPM